MLCDFRAAGMIFFAVFFAFIGQIPVFVHKTFVVFDKISKRYNTTIKSPIKPSCGERILTPKTVATRITLKQPKKGAKRKK